MHAKSALTRCATVSRRCERHCARSALPRASQPEASDQRGLSTLLRRRPPQTPPSSRIEWTAARRWRVAGSTVLYRAARFAVGVVTTWT